MKLGSKILELRKKKGLSQEELSEKIGVTRQTISNWELGETSPNPEQLKLLSKELNISIDELLDNDIQNTLFEKVSSTEEVAQKILKSIKRLIITVILIVVFTLLCLFVLKLFDVNKEKLNKFEETIHCKLYGEEHSLRVVYDKTNNHPLEFGEDKYFMDILDLKKYDDTKKMFNIVNDYVKKNNGTCEIIKEKDLNDVVDIYIKEGTLTKEGATIIIKENVDFAIIYGEYFWLEKYNYMTNTYEKVLNTTGKECAFNAIGYYITGKPTERYHNWSCMHGELKKGLYRLVKDVHFESDLPANENNEYYIWTEFEIE